MATLDTLRPELDEENTRKLREWESILWNQYGVRISPGRLVNLVIQSVEFLDIDQTIRLAIKNNDLGSDNHDAKKKKQRIIIRSTLGKTYR
jgi:hypothetical protein